MRRSEPIAIVGIGCRMPGGISSPSAFWRLLCDEVDATTEVPRDRWDADALFDSDPDAPGAIFVKRGGFLERIDEFEPEFFGISPREALGMDPQQRLLLEVVWEALEDASIPPERLSGSNTGVWVGMCLDDYARRSVTSGDLTQINPYTALGNSRSVAAGRIAYVLNLRGVVVQLDTACSSSLVAVHQACQSLRSGETDLAIVAGVNLMSSPEATVALCKLHALSPDGRCKAFDASADGYARGEGCGGIVLQRLSDARASGARIHAVIRGSAVNHDGRSNGLTAPNGAAQEAVIRTALANAGVQPGDVSYVEAHGTGTLLGDPIEVLALGRTYARERSLAAPLYVGTVKTNFGHLEGAAGIAGLIKLTLCLSHGQIAPSLNFREPNPKIPWNTLPIRVAAGLRAWPEGDRLRAGAVSSFGISGTNAHLILEQAPITEPLAVATRSAELVVLSARTPEALLASARRLREHLSATPEVTLRDVALTLVAGRQHFEHRLAFAVPTKEALSQGLESAERGELSASRSLSRAAAPKIVFVFPGQGSQWLGMGRQLFAEEPAFKSALLECERAVHAETSWSVVDELHAKSESSRLDRVDVVQPVMFAFQVALAALWRTWGIEPNAVVGHSLGEVAAACVADALSIEDGAAIMCRRSKLLRKISGRGQMALVELSAAEAREALAGFEHLVTVAVCNSPRSTVLSGDPAALDRILEGLEGRGVFCRRVQVDVASHSPQVDALLGPLVSELSQVRPRQARLPMYSTVNGAVLTGLEVSAGYWADNLRKPVLFADSVQALLSDGFTVFVEISPHPLLVTAVDQIRREGAVEGLATGSLRRDQPERLTLLSSLGALYTEGAALAPECLFPDGGARVELPSYAWQRQRYWLEPPAAPRGMALAAPHPLLGTRLNVAGGDAVFEAVLSKTAPSWLDDHRVGGRAMVPAAMMLEMFRQAAAQSQPELTTVISNLAIQAPLILPEEGSRRVQVVAREHGRKLSLYSQAALGASEAWTLHAIAEAMSHSGSRVVLDLTALRQRCPERLDVAALYDELASRGLSYGPSFRGLTALWRGEQEAFAEIEIEASGRASAPHPALLDAALQSVIGALDLRRDGSFLPFEVGRYELETPNFSRGFVHVKLTEPSQGEIISADLAITDSAGTVLAEIVALRLRRVDPRRLVGEKFVGRTALHRVEWQPVNAAPEASAPLSGSWLVVSVGAAESARAIAAALSARGVSSRWTDNISSGLSGAERIICVWDGKGIGSEDAIAAAHAGLMIARAAAGQRPAPKLWWLTRAAVATRSGEDVSPASTTVWGLGRTLIQEHPELECVLVDLEPDAPIDVVLREFAATDGENQVAWRKGQRYVARLARVSGGAPALPDGDNYALDVDEKGSLQTLRLEPSARRAPGALEIEIEVRASGLNFRDVLTALGMVNAGRLGGECAGVVSATGADVKHLAVGDRVMAIAEGTFSRFVRTDARLATTIPESLSFEQAATVPVAFLTAWYALYDLAKLKRGECLLVHAAAGGVGTAAIQLAQAAGAEVLATASASKWEHVRSMGVARVESSRDLQFAQAFREEGVDVVLNSLTGEFIEASLSLLGEGGRFIEMGKVDIRDEAAIVSSFPGVSYQAFDLIDAGLERIAEMLAAVRQGLETGVLRPLPMRSFEITDAESAFRYMAQARHVGKIVLVPPAERLELDGTVLITGGLGALGLEVARELCRCGVRRLLLAGRRGLETPGAREAIGKLEALGVEVAAVAVDSANRDDLARLIRDLPAERPLVGVVHAAGLLDDGLLAEQTAERFARVLSPKVEGAWNLHLLTRDLPLSFFVLFSSLAGTIGSASQGAYAAGNAFLDGLAAHRRALGLPGSSLAWGPWAKVGLAAGLDSRLRARLARQGIGEIEPQQGVALMTAAMQYQEALLVVAPLDLRAAAQAFGSAIPSLWRALLESVAPRTAEPASAWTPRLLALPPEERLDALTHDVRKEAARVLSLASLASVPADRNLKELGLDSLMALELRNNLGRRAGFALSASLIFEHQTPRAIARFLLTQLRELGGPADAASLGAATVPLDAASQSPGSASEQHPRNAAVSEVARCELQNRVESPVARLFCFHDAAGTAATFTPFSRLSDSKIEVHTIAVARPTPMSPTAPREYLEAAVRYILDGSNVPFVLLGHSLGALFALRVAEHLAAAKLPEPLMLVASAPPPPGEITLDEAAISAMFGHFLGSSARAPEILRENFMADFFICRGLPRGQLPLPKTPISVFLGTSDPFVSAQSAELWRPLTAREFSVTTVPGNHFYIHRSDSRELLLQELARSILAEALSVHRPADDEHPPHSRLTAVS